MGEKNKLIRKRIKDIHSSIRLSLSRTHPNSSNRIHFKTDTLHHQQHHVISPPSSTGAPSLNSTTVCILRLSSRLPPPPPPPLCNCYLLLPPSAPASRLILVPAGRSCWTAPVLIAMYDLQGQNYSSKSDFIHNKNNSMKCPPVVPHVAFD